MEGQDRKQKLRLDKKQFENRVRARFGSETCARRYFIYRYKYYTETGTF